jgi:hypothetical protein
LKMCGDILRNRLEFHEIVGGGMDFRENCLKMKIVTPQTG